MSCSSILLFKFGLQIKNKVRGVSLRAGQNYVRNLRAIALNCATSPRSEHIYT